jgi:Helix-turn-helix domain
MTSAARPKWINDPISAAIGRIVMLEERMAECERQLEQIAQQDRQIKFLEERVAQLTRPRALLTIPEAVEYLGMSARTLKRWRDEKHPRIPFILLEGGDIRYRPEAIDEFLRDRERGEKAKKGAGK